MTAVPGGFRGDTRDFDGVFTLLGDAEFVSVQELDLEGWRRPAFTTVFYTGERTAGSPGVDGAALSTEFIIPSPASAPPYESPAKRFGNVIELSAANLKANAESTTAPARTGSEGLPLTGWMAAGEPEISRDNDELRVRTPEGRVAYAVSYPRLEVKEAGTYIFELRYKLIDGNIYFGLLSGDRSRWLQPAASDTLDGEELVKTLTLPMTPGDQFVLLIANNHVVGDIASEFVLKKVRCFLALK